MHEGRDAWVSVDGKGGNLLLYGEELTDKGNKSHLISWCLGEVGRDMGHNFE